MSDYMINKASDQIDAGLSEREKIQKENRYLRMALNRLYSAVSGGELLCRDYIKETLMSVPRDMAIEALLSQDKRQQSRIKELESCVASFINDTDFFVGIDWSTTSEEWVFAVADKLTAHNKKAREVITKHKELINEILEVKSE